MFAALVSFRARYAGPVALVFVCFVCFVFFVVKVLTLRSLRALRSSVIDYGCCELLLPTAFAERYHFNSI